MSVDDLFAELCLTNTHGDLHRNIVSLRRSENLFDDLSSNPADWDTATATEMLAKQTGYASQDPIIHRPFEEAAWFDAIGFPFREWTESRYSNGTYGVWYGATDLETTIHESIYHWTRFLSDPGFLRPGVSQDRRVHMIRCDALLVDLRPRVSTFPKLVSKNDYSFTQQVGLRLHKEGHPGLVTESARCVGDVHAIFNPMVLSDPRQLCYLTYRVAAPGKIDVERTPHEVFLSISI
ncbi:MAG: RES family NAD+ phosphorylase [Nitrospirae bacterium]|nr:RES family NAD+ phosphorylase [Nitrospirota bacterium]MCL5285878.1 RES family NAD+ phosphorylase [Nitrospirota bacterium]